jgi:hypothetical protein
MNGSLSGGGFRCLNCGAFVSTAPPRSGVRNRNHCPYCLWSRHLDWMDPGDRLSACKGGMPSIGLTFKRIRKKFVSGSSGELMVIHRCVECRCVSVNRIAGDDLAESLQDLFGSSLGADGVLRSELQRMGIRMLGPSDWPEVSRRLFGEVRRFDAAVECGYDLPRMEQPCPGRNIDDR